MMGMMRNSKKMAATIVDNVGKSDGYGSEHRGDPQYFRHDEMKDPSIGDMGIDRSMEECYHCMKNDDMEGFKTHMKTAMRMMMNGPEIKDNPGDHNPGSHNSGY